MDIDQINHTIEDEELKCLIEARKIFNEGGKDQNCEKCIRAWSLIDQAILAKYSVLARESRKGESDG